jgi:hypothetical protein
VTTRTAQDRLHGLISDLADQGEPVPCTGRDEWISEAPAAREAAAWGCQRCPVLAACRAAADEIRPTAGVWAGRPYGVTGKPSKRPIVLEDDGHLVDALAAMND